MKELSKEERLKLIWKQLNELGIYTVEEAYEAYEKTKPIDITPMVAPVNWEEIRRMQKEGKWINEDRR